MKTSLHRIGNSQGIIIPKPILAQLGLTDGEMELTVERDAIVLRKRERKPREGWAEAARSIAATGGDALVWPEFANEDDRLLKW